MSKHYRLENEDTVSFVADEECCEYDEKTRYTVGELHEKIHSLVNIQVLKATHARAVAHYEDCIHRLKAELRKLKEGKP